MAAAPAVESEVGPEAGLLDVVRTETRLANQAEVRRLQLVVEWCAAHEVDEEDSSTYVEFGRDTGLALAGAGARFVSEFAVTELATALGMTTDAGKRYVGKVLEVRYRLPGFWTEVVAVRLPWWRAARVAEHTLALPEDGAAFVDGRLAWCAAKVSFGQVERLCEEALVLSAPEEAEAKRKAAADGRRFDIHTDRAGHQGTVEVTGTLDYADAADLENAIAQGAAELKQLGSDESLDVRRSQARGVVGAAAAATGPQRRPPDRGPGGRAGQAAADRDPRAESPTRRAFSEERSGGERTRRVGETVSTDCRECRRRRTRGIV